MTSTSINSLFSLDDKICLVTGGSRGFGYQMVQGFLEADAVGLYHGAHRHCVQRRRNVALRLW